MYDTNSSDLFAKKCVYFPMLFLFLSFINAITLIMLLLILSVIAMGCTPIFFHYCFTRRVRSEKIYQL